MKDAEAALLDTGAIRQGYVDRDGKRLSVYVTHPAICGRSDHYTIG